MLFLLSAIVFGSLTLLTFLIFIGANEGNRIANRWLGVFLLSITALALDDCLYAYGIYAQVPHLYGITDVMIFVMAPSFYFSVRYFTSPNPPRIQFKWLHFVPVLLFFLWKLPFYWSDAASKRAYLDNLPGPGGFGIFFFFLVLQLAIYLVLSLRILNRHQRNIQLFTASVERIDLHWLRRTIYGIIFLVFIWIGDQIFSDTNLFSRLGYISGIFYLAYFALRQSEVFSFSEVKLKEEIATIFEDANESKNEKRKLLTEAELEVQKNRLLQWMDQKKPYLENDLSLPSLAQQLQLSTNELSYLLNAGFGENFFQFINRYRVEESKRLLTDPGFAHLSMLGIAYEAGFNSKTVFNTNFKKATGVAPSEYRQKTN